MPVYTFELQDGELTVGDEDGLWFAERQHALDHAHRVARELMTARELQTRSWRLDVYEDGQRVDEIRFAGVDGTLDHLSPRLRMTVEHSCDRLRDYKAAVAAARATIRESRALVALSRGKPYLATERGEPTIRPSPPRRKYPGTPDKVNVKEV
jgi:hypothetical protein